MRGMPDFPSTDPARNRTQHSATLVTIIRHVIILSLEDFVICFMQNYIETRFQNVEIDAIQLGTVASWWLGLV